MAKHKPETEEILPEWDCGTYQTGSTTPPKSSNGRFTLLFLTVIFLGGLLSGMGLVNQHQLQDKYQENNNTIPVNQGEYTLSLSEDSVFNTDIPTPQIPADRQFVLTLENSPYYSQNSDQLLDAAQIREKTKASLAQVHILTRSHNTRTAVGLVMSADGYILTNAHLLESAKQIFVYLSDGRLLPAAVGGSDILTDLAVLYVQAQDLTPAVFGTSNQLQVDDPVYTAVTDQEITLKKSGVFNVSRKFSTAHNIVNLIQTYDDPKSGPVFNSYGQVVGLCVSRTAKYFGTANNLGLVLGSNAMQSLVQQLVQQGYVSGRPDMGFEVEEIAKLYQQYWQLPGGLRVSGIQHNGDQLHDGDILLALNGKSLSVPEDLYAVIYGCAIGQEITAVVFREGKQITLRLTVGQQTQ